MTDKLQNTAEVRPQYKSPAVKLVDVRPRSILCGSPEVNLWGEGSESEGEFMKY